MTASDWILEVQDLSKTYWSFRKEPGLLGAVKALVRRERVPIEAVKHLSFGIERGAFVGLLGPNGAGKTTTLKMLTGLIAPSTGRAIAFGQYDTARRHAGYLRRIGMVMGQRNQLNPDLPAMDSFRLAKAIYGISEQNFDRRLAACTELFAVGPLLTTPVRKLSLGERMKMELILSLLHEPELLFLDEPTIGLDFHAAEQIRDFLGEANRQLGVTVVLTSHYTKDIEALCRRVILINHGTIVFDGPLSGLDSRLMGQRRVTLTFADDLLKTRSATWLTNFGATLEAAAVAEGSAEHALTASIEPSRVGSLVHGLIGEIGDRAICDLKVSERPLEDVFAELYRQPARPEAP